MKRVLGCQPKKRILFPPFRYSGPVKKISGPVDSWCSLVLDQCSFGKKFNIWINRGCKSKNDDNSVIKRKRTNAQTMIYRTLHRTLNIEQHKPH